MSDVIFIAVMIAFFVLCTLYVQLCDRMIGPDDPAMAGSATDAVIESVPTAMVATDAAGVSA